MHVLPFKSRLSHSSLFWFADLSPHVGPDDVLQLSVLILQRESQLILPLTKSGLYFLQLISVIL